MGLIYYKGEPYGDGSISPSEVLTFYAIEGEAPASGVINKIDTGTVDEHGNPIYRVEIPMGTTIENAFATDTIETHVIEDTEKVRLQADVGTRLKFNGTPDDGIICGGVRILVPNSNIIQDSGGHPSSIDYIRYAKAEILNYMYSSLLFPKKFDIYTNVGEQYLSDHDYWTTGTPKDWTEYQIYQDCAYFLNNNHLQMRPGRFSPFYYLSNNPELVVNKILNIPRDGGITASNIDKNLIKAFGFVYQYDQMLERNNTIYVRCTPKYAVLTDIPEGETHPEGCDYKIVDASYYRPDGGSQYYYLFPMTEDEVRYAMGVSDLFEQMTYEEYVERLPHE